MDRYGDQEYAGRFGFRNKVRKITGHRRYIAGDQNPSGGCGKPENFRIGNRVGDDALSAAEINGEFPPAQTPHDFGIEIGIGLECDLQSG